MTEKIGIPDEMVLSKIYLIRGHKVMLDRDLAELYGVETKVLKQAVRRNIDRFPDDFMFEMNKDELENWRSQFVTSNSDKQGLRYLPFCFGEMGLAMLSSILNSKQAIQVNILIMRVFTNARKMLMDTTELRLEIEKIKRTLTNHDKNMEVVFQYVDELQTKIDKLSPNPKLSENQIGFKINEKD